MRPSARRPCSLRGVRRRARCLRTWLISTSSPPRGNLSSSTTSGAAIPSQAAVRTRIGPPPKTRAMMLERARGSTRIDADGRTDGRTNPPATPHLSSPNLSIAQIETDEARSHSESQGESAPSFRRSVNVSSSAWSCHLWFTRSMSYKQRSRFVVF